jgi:hypothetical protein
VILRGFDWLRNLGWGSGKFRGRLPNVVVLGRWFGQRSGALGFVVMFDLMKQEICGIHR